MQVHRRTPIHSELTGEYFKRHLYAPVERVTTYILRESHRLMA